MKKKASSIKLSDVIADFSSALEQSGQNKTASDENLSEDANSSESSENKDHESKTASEPVSVTDSLRKIAEDAVTTEKIAMEKEAGEFGKFFAQGFVQELNKTAHINQAYANGYNGVMEKIAAVQGEHEAAMQKISEEAYDVALDRIATVQGSQVFQKIAEEAYEATIQRITTAPDSPLFYKIAQEAYAAAHTRIAESADSQQVKLAHELMAVTTEAYDITKARIRQMMG